MNFIKISLRILMYVLLVTLICTFFLKNRLVGIDNVIPETLEEPVQEEMSPSELITFEKDGYKYEAKPNYSYTLSGIVVHKKGYSILGTEGADKTAPYDLCIVWGNNVKEKTYLAKGIKFSQDQRWCMYSYKQPLTFYQNQLSNNHLLIRDKENYKTEKSINVGDEVEIKGYLVDVKASKLDGDGEYFTWNSSTSRDDNGAGACEVILVESVKIKNRANPIMNLVYTLSKYALLAVIILRIIIFFIPTNSNRTKDVPVDLIQKENF